MSLVEPKNLKCWDYYTAIGYLCIKKGEKFMWKFQMHDAKKYILIGVIDDGKLEQNKNDVVCDFTDTKWNGMGITSLECK